MRQYITESTSLTSNERLTSYDSDQEKAKNYNLFFRHMTSAHALKRDEVLDLSATTLDLL